MSVVARVRLTWGRFKHTRLHAGKKSSDLLRLW